MHRIGIVEASGGIRALSECEITIVGGGDWLDVAYNILNAASVVSPTIEAIKFACNAVPWPLNSR